MRVIVNLIQVFWFGFTFAISALVGLGIYTGNIDRFAVQNKITQITMEYIAAHPEILDNAMAAYMGLNDQSEEQSKESQSSLGALKERQQTD